MASKFDVKSINVLPALKIDIRTIGKKITSTPNLLKQCLLVSGKCFEPAVEEMYEASQQLCRHHDIVIGYYLQYTLYTAAEKYHIPRVSVCLTPPAIPSAYYPPQGAPDLGPLLNSVQHILADTIGPRFVFPSLNKLQAREGLSSVKRYAKQITLSKDLTLVAVSPSFFPSKPDWDDNVKACGFLNVPACEDVWHVPQQLLEFIRAASPPIYATFGSKDHYQPENNLRLLIDAIKLSKQRAIIQTTIDRVFHPIDDPHVFLVNKVPHHAVFPLCYAVVHHGGVGTTLSSLLAGVSSVVVAHAYDQTFWAQQSRHVGVTKRVLHRRSVTPGKLADAINAIRSSPQCHANAKKTECHDEKMGSRRQCN